MENTNNIDVLIIRLLSGEADLSEKKIIGEWLELSASNKKMFSDLREIWLSSGIQTNADHYHLEEAIQNFRKQINTTGYPRNNQFRLPIFVKYAAILLMVLSLPFCYYLGTKYSLPDNTVTTISCAFGDKTSITLPDSSRVWLNSGSKLTFNSDFKHGPRKVNLEGEAFFAVTRDKHHPFRVKTADVNIEVLGTNFNVKAYPDERLVSTTLVEGSIKISSLYQKTQIKPNQRVVFSKESKEMVIEELSDASIDTDWKDGRLVFRNESLEELAPKLRRWFDVDIVFADERVKNRRFTGVLERESILEVVSYFDLSKFVECRIQGNKIIIKSEK
jgi:ferric-dicitrate binding protein FerR (iron transport regulator)